VSEAKGKTSMGLEPNVAGLLCYVVGWVTGIILLILEKENQFVRFHAVQDLHVERAVVEQRRRGVAPVQAKGTVVLLDVARPQLAAREVESLEYARPGDHPDARAVGDRRRRGHVLLALPVVASAERRLPEDGAVQAAHTPQLEVAAHLLQRHVQEDPIVPDDRRRAAAGRHRERPGDILGRRPRDRQPFLGAHAVQVRPSPLRPVLRGYGAHSANDEHRRQA